VPIPSIDTVGILAGAICVSFFARGAHMDGKSPVLWGGMSLALWLAVTWFLGGGLALVLGAQVLLFAGITVVHARRDALAAGRTSRSTRSGEPRGTDT
jgi:hypothetical protein